MKKPLFVLFSIVSLFAPACASTFNEKICEGRGCEERSNVRNGGLGGVASREQSEMSRCMQDIGALPDGEEETICRNRIVTHHNRMTYGGGGYGAYPYANQGGGLYRYNVTPPPYDPFTPYAGYDPYYGVRRSRR